MTDCAYLGIAEAGACFRDGTLSPVELVQDLLDRIENLNSVVGAFLLVDAENALWQAKHAQAEMAAGRWRGPMHGIPVAVKDMIDVCGLPTTCHSAILSGNLATRDARVIARLIDAGAIILGKTSMHEFAIGGPSHDLPWPPARNPWDSALHPGGSSSGSAAAVVAGFAPAALGTDTGGSVRHPATACGLVGLKPTYDRVSREGVFPLAFSLDHVGPLTRSVVDNAILFSAIKEPAPTGSASSASSVPAMPPTDLKGLRIGLLRHFHEEVGSADARLAGGLNDAVEILKQLGAVVEDVQLAPLSVWSDCGRIIQQAEQYVVHENWLRSRPQDYCEASRSKLIAGAFLMAKDYLKALQARRVLCEQFADLMVRFDAVVSLSSFHFPCKHDDEAAISRTYARHARMPFNLTGTPAMALPVGFADNGLPLGIQIAGKAYDEAVLFRIGSAYESATGWSQRRADLASAGIRQC